jgi:hypothetical protein
MGAQGECSSDDVMSCWKVVDVRCVDLRKGIRMMKVCKWELALLPWTVCEKVGIVG